MCISVLSIARNDYLVCYIFISKQEVENFFSALIQWAVISLWKFISTRKSLWPKKSHKEQNWLKCSNKKQVHNRIDYTILRKT